VFSGPETPPKSVCVGSEPWNVTFTKQNTVWAILRANRSLVATCTRDEETERKREIRRGEHKYRDISPLFSDSTCEPIWDTFGILVGLIDVVTYAKNVSKIVNECSRATCFPSYPFPYPKPTAYETLPCATACLWVAGPGGCIMIRIFNPIVTMDIWE
jgi:hypothetical protein